MHFNSFAASIQKGVTKLEKYIPRKHTPTTIYKLKPFILGLILDPRLKLRHLKRNGLLYHYETIYQDGIEMLKEEYYKYIL